MLEDIEIVDGHVHTFSSAEVSRKILKAFNKAYDIKFRNSGTGEIADLLGKMAKSRIDYTIMANFAPPKILHKNNLWTIGVSKKNRNLIPLVSFNPAMEGSMPDLLLEYVEKGARGIKLHPMAQDLNAAHPALMPVYGLCSQLKLPIVFHCGRVSNARLNKYSDLDMLLPVIDKFPDIPFILAHMVDGNGEDAVYVAKNYGNVYFDTSIVITGSPSVRKVNEPSWLDDNMVVDIINEVGAENVVFGSDYPWGDPEFDIKRVMGLDITLPQKKAIFGLNAKRLFNIA